MLLKGDDGALSGSRSEDDFTLLDRCQTSPANKKERKKENKQQSKHCGIKFLKFFSPSLIMSDFTIKAVK